MGVRVQRPHGAHGPELLGRRKVVKSIDDPVHSLRNGRHGLSPSDTPPDAPTDRQALAATDSRAFCQSALNWTIPLSVSG